jgi:hypothetical protein
VGIAHFEIPSNFTGSMHVPIVWWPPGDLGQAAPVTFPHHWACQFQVQYMPLRIDKGLTNPWGMVQGLARVRVRVQSFKPS